MREIKFRAWDLRYGGRMLPWQEIFDNMTCQIFNNEDYALMQYTGLKDKNGKEIYEGDIVKHSIADGHDWSGIHEVLFDSGAFKLKGGNPHGMRYGEIFNYYPNNVTVIGNIYQHPELLKEPAK